MKIPDKWENYEAIGKLISGTRFIAFKVPLAAKFNEHLPLGVAPFTPRLLVEEVEKQNLKLGLVIDLTNTNKYYFDKLITDQGVGYKKIYTEGHKVPNVKVIRQFFGAVDTFLKENNDNSDVIGVHCTHGINRTGYLICRYMINKMNKTPDESIQAFNKARGHTIERENYLADLYNPGRKLIGQAKDANCATDKDEEEEEVRVESSSAAAETWRGHHKCGQQLGKGKFHNDADDYNSYGYNDDMYYNNNTYNNNNNMYNKNNKNNNAYYNNVHRFNNSYNNDNSYNRPSYNSNYDHNNSHNNNHYNHERPTYRQNNINSYNRFDINYDINDDINKNNSDINYVDQQHGYQNHSNNTICTSSNSAWLNSPYYKSFSQSINNFQQINHDNVFGNTKNRYDIDNYSNTQKSFTDYKQRHTHTNNRYNAYNNNSNSRFQNDKQRYNPNYDRYHYNTNQNTLQNDVRSVTSSVNVIPPNSKK